MHKLLMAAGFAALLTTTLSSCEKDQRIKPEINLKSDAGRIYKDTTLKQDTTFKVYVEVKKTEDELKSYNTSVTYDGGSSTTLKNEDIKGSEQDGFGREHALTTRKQAGKETYQFTVTDRDGNISSKAITITVK